ncbi:MAG: S8 family serine peptidase, partial [Verrucomicrobiota bacterium]|nr:S8 family serine peptidase [Verrucomicrobiota bacterium]
MKNRQTLSAVLLTALVAGLAYLGISRGPVMHQSAPALGQAPAVTPQRLARPMAIALPQTAPAKEDPFPFRLRNTDAPIGDLIRNETAVLLRNAFIDTALGQALPIPAGFKAEGDPLTYIAQSRGPATAAFRRNIASIGGTIISYIPNNAYLVRMDAAGAERLARWHGTQSVLPFEPYYKLEMKLLKMALTGQALSEGALLNVVLFPGSEPDAARRLARLGVEVLSQDRTPFGAKLIARVPGGKLAALARLTGVQGLERHRPRRLANDLTRPRLGVEVYTVETNAAGAVTNVVSEDHLALTGQGIYVNINDSGVDESHADFGRRLKGPGVGQDSDGHGTFVAGIIAGDGAGSDTIKTNPPPGSFKDPDFRGMAPKARLHVLKADDDKVNNHVSDSWLQTESANYHYPKRKYALISNNSWEYEEENDYTWAAASYDAATRDALPDQPGDQQVIYVFPAGNSGAGTDNGLNASPNTITAPGTAKNVITVGAIESGREIVAESYTYETNTVTETDEDGNELEKEVVTTTTNTPFAGMSDSNNEVAAFSSRGNVGIGIEGQYGRFKPDLVAPGTFIISTRSSDWKNTITSTNAQDDADSLEGLNDELGDQYRYESGTSVAAPAISGMLALMQEFYRKLEKPTNSPALMKALLINSAASVDARYDHNVRGTVNHQGWGLPNLQRAAPALAKANPTDENTWHPADENTWPMRFIDQSLTNALATGESRSWEITLGTNALHYPLRFTLAWTDPPGNPNAAVKLVNDLDLIVTPISSSSEDPNDPADPSDPEDESEETEEVYYGNNIGASVYSSMGATNDVINNVENVFIEEPNTRNYRVTVYARRVNVDSLSAFYDAEEPVDHIDVVQDFALVMSSANPELEGVFDDVKSDKPEVIELPAIASLTNGMPMLHQRVGANSALAKETDQGQTVYANRRGITNQWHFYTFVNAPKKKEDSDDSDDPEDPNSPDDPGESGDDNQPSFGKHVAFITFMPPNLSSPRHREADIDLYVSRDSNLTNLEPAVLDAAFRSTDRGGSEFITFDDAKVDESEVFYIGVKSEDQMAAEYGLVGLSTDDPNGFMDPNGNLTMMPLPAIIPDGSAADPGGVSVFGIYAGMPYDYVRKVTATSIIHHEEVGDLWGQLSHNRNAVVLNNHTLAEPVTGKPYPTDFVFVYDDELDSSRIMPGSIPTDGPGSLNDFQWEPAMGVWQLDMVDSALTFTGLVEHLNVKVDAIKNLSMIGNRGIDVHLDPGESEDFLVEVPFNATNMIVQLTEMTGPVDVFIRKDIEPDIDADPQVYDKSTIDAGVKPGLDGKIGTEDDIVEWDGSPPRGELHYGLNDSPPLSEGRWFVTIDNPELTEVDFHLKVIFEYDISMDNTIKLVSDEPEPIEDDIVTKSILTVTNDFLVGMAEVGVRIDHPRIADLDLHLVSPQGTRLLLSENRGHTN